MNRAAEERLSDPGAPCAAHREAPAAAVCERCGAFSCETCLRSSPAFDRLCRACDERLAAGASSAPIAALISACFAFAVLPGFLALVLAHLEQRRIDTGRASPEGTPWLRMARGVVVAQWLLLAGWAIAP